MQEPFRFLIDIAIINLLENNSFDNKVEFQGHECSWHFVLITKTREFAQFLLGQNKNVNFGEPIPELERIDSAEMRKKILNISYKEAQKLGISKGGLHYMKHNVKNNKPFKIYDNIQEKLMTNIL